MQEKFYVSIPVDTEGWTEADKDFFQQQVAFEAQDAARVAYGKVQDEIMRRKAESMRGQNVWNGE